MKVAIMQPYLFPYIGYYHLIMSSDIFVIYDDVSYMKQSFINRNNILLNAEKHRFTLAVPKGSSNALIKDLCYSDDTKKLIKTFTQAYLKAPYYRDFFPILEKILLNTDKSINRFCLNSILDIFNYLGIQKNILLSSELEYDREANASGKVISICQLLNADTYINSPGGRSLYNKDMFLPYGIDLKFVSSKLIEYKQINNDIFKSGLSIIDILMHNSVASIVEMLDEFSCED